ncbi:kinesin-like protein KIN-5C [Tanacetum coccineum]
MWLGVFNEIDLACLLFVCAVATPEGEELIKCGKLNLVDLAGSENISRSGAREWETVVNGGEDDVERLELMVVKSSHYGGEGGERW